MIKRGFDIAGALLLLTLFSPLLLIVAIAIKRSGPGKITYAHKRIGRHGVPFPCLKFRTMVSNADEVLRRWSIENPDLYEQYLKTFKLKDDPRVTPIGRWLRRTSLDELPQLWSVLLGQMSLVGPRPALFNQDDLVALRTEAGVHSLRPGLTGWAQVNGRDELPIPEKVKLDAEYLRRRSLAFDLRILLATAASVFGAKGISH
jgi:O-antigen biosynthesis protein WbqP